ncbi:hypothetical protein [Escherichia coli]|uniref:hypothetical protein n=1 Tax=Escherichia coli TaxID=562 RepID=UPI003890F9AD
MGLFHQSAEKEKLEALENVISKNNRGIFKRIDENRELLELLYEKTPELMDECSRIRGWIESQDEFLSKLAEVSGVENRTYNLTLLLVNRTHALFRKNRIVLRILRMRVIPYE